MQGNKAGGLRESRPFSRHNCSEGYFSITQGDDGMNITLWVVQILVGLLFLVVGFAKAFLPVDRLAERLAWAPAVPRWFLRFIGWAELAGGVGLILPAATKILPWLTVGAAIGLVVVMASAIFFHISRKEYPNIGGNLVLLLLAAFIFVGRLAWAPF
jgi:uncharacterized membrane protein YphA (DoxX/SURF4 family)